MSGFHTFTASDMSEILFAAIDDRTPNTGVESCLHDLQVMIGMTIRLCQETGEKPYDKFMDAVDNALAATRAELRISVPSGAFYLAFKDYFLLRTWPYQCKSPPAPLHGNVCCLADLYYLTDHSANFVRKGNQESAMIPSGDLRSAAADPDRLRGMMSFYNAFYRLHPRGEDLSEQALRARESRGVIHYIAWEGGLPPRRVLQQ